MGYSSSSRPAISRRRLMSLLSAFAAPAGSSRWSLPAGLGAREQPRLCLLELGDVAAVLGEKGACRRHAAGAGKPQLEAHALLVGGCLELLDLPCERLTRRSSTPRPPAPPARRFSGRARPAPRGSPRRWEPCLPASLLAASAGHRRPSRRLAAPAALGPSLPRHRSHRPCGPPFRKAGIEKAAPLNRCGSGYGRVTKESLPV